MLVTVASRFIDALGGTGTRAEGEVDLAISHCLVSCRPSVAAVLRIGFVGTGLIAWAHGLGLKAMIDGGVIDASFVAAHDQSERRAACGLPRAMSDSAGRVRRGRRGRSGRERRRRGRAIGRHLGLHAHLGAPQRRRLAAVSAGPADLLREAVGHLDLWRADALVQAVPTGGQRGGTESGLVLACMLRSSRGALRELVAGGSLGRPMAAIFRYGPVLSDPRSLRLAMARRRGPKRVGAV